MYYKPLHIEKVKFRQRYVPYGIKTLRVNTLIGYTLIGNNRPF